jgi:putative peptidoglycan lipid II flippase
MVLVLIVPAAVGLFVMAEPLISLLFQHGKFTATDTYWTAMALRYYLLGLTFAAIDWPLNYAFYARQDTLTPALVGVLSVGVYLAVALPLVGPMGMLGLVLADSVKHFGHAVVMLFLTRRRIGGLKDLELGQTAIKSLLASAVMAGLMVLALATTDRLLDSDSLPSQIFVVGLVGGVGLLSYLIAVLVLRVNEIQLLWTQIRRRMHRTKLD